MTSSVSGRYVRLVCPRRKPPSTAGIHPARPVRSFSYRSAWTSSRPAKRWRKNVTLSTGEEEWSTAPGNPPKSGDRGASSGKGRGPTRPTSRARRSFSLRSRSSSRRSSRSSASCRVRAEPDTAKVSPSSTRLCDLRAQDVALCVDNIELLCRQLRPIWCRFLVRSHPDLRFSAPRSPDRCLARCGGTSHTSQLR